MKEELGTWGAVVGAVVLACLFGGLALAIYPGWATAFKPLIEPSFPWGTFWTAASAIGTFAAAVAAVWVANRQSAVKRSDDELRAQLHAAGISVRLSRFSNRLTTFEVWAGLPMPEDNAELSQVFFLVQKWFSDGYYKPTDAEMLALVCLPNFAANRLARGYEALAVLSERVAADGGLSRLFLRSNLDGRKKLIQHIHAELRVASKLIAAACLECVKASQLGAPHPEGDGDGDQSQ